MGADVYVVEASGDSAALLKAQVTCGNIEWDITIGWGEAVQRRFASELLLAKLDFGKIPGSRDLAPGTYIDYGIASDLEAVVAAYSTAEGVKPLASFTDFFDVENFPGHVPHRTGRRLHPA